MEEEVKNPETETQDVDYVAAIQELRDRSVPKEQYEKLKGENAKLLKSLINGEQMEAAGATSTEPTIKELREELYGGEGFQGSDIDFWKKTLDLRDKVIEEEGYDPMVPRGHQASPTPADYAAAEHVATVVREVIEYANGDNALFISELNKRMSTTAMDRMKK